MKAESQRPKGRDGAISALNAAIEALDLAKTSNVTQAKAVFGSASILLATIRVYFLLSGDDFLQVHGQLGFNG